MHTILIIVHVLAAAGLIVMVLLQQGKGADAGAAFGSGASATVFGAQGSASFLTRATAILATVFFVTSLSLAVFTGQQVERKSVTESVVTTVPEQPASEPAAADVPDVPQSAPEGTQ